MPTPGVLETFELLEEIRREYKHINIYVGMLFNGEYSCNFKTVAGECIASASDKDMFTAVHAAYERFILEIEKRGGKSVS